MRELYRWDRAKGELVKVAETTAQSPVHPMVIRDIEPYRSMRTGERIAGRRQHRDHLRAYGLVELGNDMPQVRRQELSQSDRVQDIKRAMGEG